MHLIELIAVLEAVKVHRGNILLVDVVVMAAGDREPIADHQVDRRRQTEEAQPEQENSNSGDASSSEADVTRMLAIPLKDRLTRCEPGGALPITDAELRQLFEYRDELQASYQIPPAAPAPIPFRPRALDEVPAAMFIEAARDQLRTVEAPKLQDQLKELHFATGEGDPKFQAGYNLGLETARVCIETLPPRQLIDIREAQKGAPMLPPDLEGKSTEVRMPCPQFDEKKVGCVLPFGHEGDHNFDSTASGAEVVDRKPEPEHVPESLQE